jgi:voltage-gated potassium channel
LWDLSPAAPTTFVALDAFIWAAFAVDLGIKVVVAPYPPAYLRTHSLEVLVVAVPFSDRSVCFGCSCLGHVLFAGARRLVHVDVLLVYGVGLVVIAATVVTSVENGDNATITSFPDALWLAVVTITTVGYSDAVSVTAAGRAIGVILMLGGIAFFSGLIANLASLLVREEDRHKTTPDKLMKKTERL